MLDPKTLRPFLMEKSMRNPKLIAVLKIDRAGKVRNDGESVDEFNLASMQRFSLSPLARQDKALMAKAQG